MEDLTKKLPILNEKGSEHDVLYVMYVAEDAAAAYAHKTRYGVPGNVRSMSTEEKQQLISHHEAVFGHRLTTFQIWAGSHQDAYLKAEPYTQLHSDDLLAVRSSPSLVGELPMLGGGKYGH